MGTHSSNECVAPYQTPTDGLIGLLFLSRCTRDPKGYATCQMEFETNTALHRAHVCYPGVFAIVRRYRQKVRIDRRYIRALGSSQHNSESIVTLFVTLKGKELALMSHLCRK